MNIRKVYKYGTGDEIPKGSLYLCTKVQKKAFVEDCWEECRLVWHYFLVEVRKKK